MVVLLATFGAGVGVGRGSHAPDPELAVVAEARGRLNDLAMERPAPSSITREAVRGMLRALDDPYAEYLPKRAPRPSEDDVERRALGLEVGARTDAAGVQGRLLPSGAGYVVLKLFAPESGGLVRAEVRRLEKEGATGIVLDLRGNPGGLIDEALEVAGLFIGHKTVFRYETAGGGQGERRGIGRPVRLPVVVVVDAGTASAAELVAGAVQDAGRGLVVGERTKGKGSVQKVVELSDGSAIKFTSAIYRTPKGRKVAGQGIGPDVVVHGGPGDPQLERADAILRGAR